MTNLTVSVELDAITIGAAKAFDYPFDGTSSFSVPALPQLPDDWGIGLIVGPSGSGKSNILKSFGAEDEIAWATDKSIVSHFANLDDAIDRLGAVGLNSIPSWVRPYRVLSTGERFRADLARRLRDGAVIDEFTSVVDRNVARACANAMRKYVARTNLRRIVLATCHYDVVEWLCPDWVFDTASEQLTRGNLQPPPIVVEVRPCTTALWPIFSRHHYLDGAINGGAWCWTAIWGGQPVGFAACVAFPNGNGKNWWRGHRTVVLPDFQGLGIGVRLSDAVGQMILDMGGRYFSKTAHPRMGAYREQSSKWRATTKNRMARADYAIDPSREIKEKNHMMRHATRWCYSHEYIGDAHAQS